MELLWYIYVTCNSTERRLSCCGTDMCHVAPRNVGGVAVVQSLSCNSKERRWSCCGTDMYHVAPKNLGGVAVVQICVM